MSGNDESGRNERLADDPTQLRHRSLKAAVLSGYSPDRAAHVSAYIGTVGFDNDEFMETMLRSMASSNEPLDDKTRQWLDITYYDALLAEATETSVCFAGSEIVCYTGVVFMFCVVFYVVVAFGLSVPDF